MFYGVVYLVTNIKTGCVYVGQTKNFKNRLLGHKFDSENYPSTFFDKMLKEDGFENFKWEIIEECYSREKLNKREKELILFYNSLYPNGYNKALKGHAEPRLRQLSEEKVVIWMKKFYKVHGKYPNVWSKKMDGLPKGETWKAVNGSLEKSTRGIYNSTTLAKLKVKYFGVKDAMNPSKLSEGQIVEWSNKYYEIHGKRPTNYTKSSDGLPEGETWTAIEIALIRGTRGLLGKSSLAKFNEKYFGIRSRKSMPVITEKDIVGYMKLFKEKHGYLPRLSTKETDGLPNGDTWHALNQAMQNKHRGLDGSLARLREKYFGEKPSRKLSEKQIIAWVEKYYSVYKVYPTRNSKSNGLPKGEAWKNLDIYLRNGLRGLLGGSSLAKIRKRCFKSNEEK